MKDYSEFRVIKKSPVFLCFQNAFTVLLYLLVQCSIKYIDSMISQNPILQFYAWLSEAEHRTTV